MKSTTKILYLSIFISIIVSIPLFKYATINEAIFYFIGLSGLVYGLIHFSYGSFLKVKKLYFSNYKLNK